MASLLKKSPASAGLFFSVPIRARPCPPLRQCDSKADAAVGEAVVRLLDASVRRVVNERRKLVLAPVAERQPRGGLRAEVECSRHVLVRDVHVRQEMEAESRFDERP